MQASPEFSKVGGFDRLSLLRLLNEVHNARTSEAESEAIGSLATYLGEESPLEPQRLTEIVNGSVVDLDEVSEVIEKSLDIQEKLFEQLEAPQAPKIKSSKASNLNNFWVYHAARYVPPTGTMFSSSDSEQEMQRKVYYLLHLHACVYEVLNSHREADVETLLSEYILYLMEKYYDAVPIPYCAENQIIINTDSLWNSPSVYFQELQNSGMRLTYGLTNKLAHELYREGLVEDIYKIVKGEFPLLQDEVPVDWLAELDLSDIPF